MTEEEARLEALLDRLEKAPAIASCPKCRRELIWYNPEERPWSTTCFECGVPFVPTEFGRRTRLDGERGGRRLSDLLPASGGAAPMNAAPPGAAAKPPDAGS